MRSTSEREHFKRQIKLGNVGSCRSMIPTDIYTYLIRGKLVDNGNHWQIERYVLNGFNKWSIWQTLDAFMAYTWHNYTTKFMTLDEASYLIAESQLETMPQL